MLSRHLYYSVKPFLPWGLRMGIRRWFALRKRTRPEVQETWPILPGSEKAPEGWPGWPDGKQFAFVLTHDVEGPDGLAKVKPLAELEMRLGFRSCFNFIPEGGYRVPDELRTWLVNNGFEVGVHDLYHDGKLFSSHSAFRQRAPAINRYLKHWGAVGFRSGFMLHNLDWLHDLEIGYDASTFDTDPFEPQPQGRGTIFPFWVPRPGSDHSRSDSDDSQSKSGKQRTSSGIAPSDFPLSPSAAGTAPSDFQLSAFRSQLSSSTSPLSPSAPGTAPSDFQLSAFNSQVSPSTFPLSAFPHCSGYVELPYTLPQDSTLFLLLKETSPEIWLRKLDWIAQHGGMALVNVHPDYVHFPGETPSARTVPVAHYEQLLNHARAKHGSSFWQATPRQVSQYVAAMARRPVRRRPLRVCMVAYSFYESDNRVTRYAEALAERGDQVDVLALQSGPNVPRAESLGGVSVHRIQARFGKTERSKLGYLAPLIRFLIGSGAWITRSHLRDRYDLVHVHNVPDFLVFAALVPKLTGARVILDIHDIVPEFYASKFPEKGPAALSKPLVAVERWSAAFADQVIIANHLWLEKYAARTGAAGKCAVFINNVDTKTFRPLPRTRQDGRRILLFPGGLQWHQGLDIAIRAVHRLSRRLSEVELHIYGDGNMKPALVALAQELGLNGQVRFFEPVRIHEIAALMANADLGVVPKRADSFGNEAYSTKIMEFMAVGVPVVASDTRIDRHYFDDSVLRFFESGNVGALAGAIEELLSDDAKRLEMVSRAAEYTVRHSWESRKVDYLRLVDDLWAGKPTKEMGKVEIVKAES